MTPELTEIEFDIPQHSGEVFCHPPAAEFEAVARENAERLAASALSIDGTPLREVRHQARSRTLQRAAAYTVAMGIDVPLPPASALLLVTGHQPFLFHPGIWIKHLLAHRLAGSRHAALSIPVDSDTFEEIAADVPVLDGGLRLIRDTLVRAPADVPYEAQPAPDPASWQAFLRRLDGTLRTLNEPEIEAAFRAFVDAASNVRPAADIGTFLTTVRRRYEGRRRYREVPVSHVSRSPEFMRFFLSILRDSVRFADAFNRHLDAYRERYNVRTVAQPFSNLERDGERVELPFWFIHGGRRQSVYGTREGRGWTLSTSGDTIVTIGDGDGPDALAGIEIRPKALTLTAFSRLCVADLFIHGVGGGRYDRVTDAVIADYFGIQPPRYAVVTATLHLPLREHRTGEERQRLQRRLLELRHNPERVLRQPSSEQQRLIDDKWRLIASLDGGSLTRRERRQATQRIREINDSLSQVLAESVTEVEGALQALADAPDADAAARHRGYPFCFFPPQAIDALIDGLGV